jgi:hypothetical protein
MTNQDTMETRIGKIIDKLHVVPEQYAVQGRRIALYPQETQGTELINDGHRNALIEEIRDEIHLAEQNRDKAWRSRIENVKDWIKGMDSLPWEEDVDEYFDDLLTKEGEDDELQKEK